MSQARSRFTSGSDLTVDIHKLPQRSRHSRLEFANTLAQADQFKVGKALLGLGTHAFLTFEADELTVLAVLNLDVRL